ncbi:MAG TPA: PQQ-binding-like beta-propeller repeat protein [Candidatus Angelobacter sp.]|nr:PQQ-binding-like beta-propeller repeat protein [Candidatus Angelobacter sp.]
MRKAAVIVFLSLSLLMFLPTGGSQRRSDPHSFLNTGPVGSTDYPWTMFHYDAGRNGVTPASGPTSASLMWSYATGGIVYASPIVADGFVFIPSYDGRLYALDEYTGSLIWSFATGSSIVATPAVGNGIVYLSSKDFTVYALDENSGSMLWRISNVAPVVSSPVLADGKLFYGTLYSPSAGRAEFLALNPQDGTVYWRTTISDYIEGSAAVSNGRVFFGIGALSNAVVVALNETTGTSSWTYGTMVPTTITTAPATAYGNVYIGLDSTKFLALNQATGALLWSFNTPSASNATTPAIYNGVVYFGTGRGIVYARNATTGVQIWSYPTPTGGAVTSSPVLALGSKALFFGSNDRYLYALNAMTGTILWRYLTGGQISSSPAVANSRVFFGAKDAKVYALGIIIPSLTATLSASPVVLRSAMLSNLTVTVRNSTGPISGANLTLTASAGGTFSQPVMTIPGTYVANYTASTVTSTISEVIQVVASASGYLNAVASTSLTVNPYPPLTVVVAAKPGTTTPGAEVLLMIRVTNGTDLISGASIAMTSSSGGSFSGLTDSGNGNYTVTYTTPLQSSTNVLTVQASKNQFSSAQGQVVVTVAGIPDLTTVKVAGLPLFLFAAVAVLIFFILMALAVTRRDRSRSHGLAQPPQPSFTY